MSLTEQGEELHQKSKHLINGFDFLENETKRIKERGNEHLKIGVIESFRKFTPNLINNFKNKNENMNITILERNSDDVLNALLNYKIHFGITANEVSHKDIECIKLLERSMSIVFHTDHSFNKITNLDISHFEDQTLIQSVRGFQLYEIINDEISNNHVKLNSTINVETLEGALELVRHNIGVAIIPTPYLKSLKDDRLVSHELKGYKYFTSDINLIFHKERYLSQVVYDFIHEVIEDKHLLEL